MAGAMYAFLAAALLQSSSPPPADDDDRRPEPAHAAKPRAADDDDEDQRVDPNSAIVITARRLDDARTRIDAGLGATVYFLTNDAVENRPGGETGSIAAILAQTPGASLVGTALAIRGSRTTQVRINDVIVPEAISDPAEHLSARLAATTRVMTGTLPAQFGFAPGGVISVTTKSGAYQRGGQLELFAGTGGFVEPAVEWAGSLGGVSLFGSGSYERERTRIADAAGRSANDVRRGAEGLLFADHVLSGSDRVSLILGGARERHAIGATGIGSGTAANDDAYAVGTFQHSAAGLTVQASLFAGIASDAATFSTASRERRTTVGTQIDAAQQLGSGHLLRTGLLVASATAVERDSRGRLSSHRTPWSVYAQDEWTIGEDLTFNPGVRIDWLHGTGARPAAEPRASLVWAPANGLSAHLGYARYAAVAPLGAERGGALPDERDDYYDAGLQQRRGPFTFGLDAYLRRARNLIAERQTPGEAASAAFAYKRGDLRGVELSGTYAQGPVTAWANVSVSRARGRSIIAGGGLFAPAVLAAAGSRWLALADARPVTASAGFTWRLDELSLSADVLASSGAVRSAAAAAAPNSARAPAFATFGLAAVYRVRLVGRPADLRLDLTNANDARYVTRDASALEGGWTAYARRRALTIGIEQGF